MYIKLYTAIILYVFLKTSPTFCQNGKTWYTHWNGARKKPTNPLDLKVSTHVPSDTTTSEWELTNIYDGLSKTTANGIPAYIDDFMTKNIRFVKLLKVGTKVTPDRIRAISGAHYYGVFINENSKKKLYWISGGYLKRVSK